LSEKKLKLGVLVSGSGTNLQAIIDACESGKIPAEVKVVVSNKPGVYALERAKKHGIPNYVVDHKLYQTREDFEREVIKILKEHEVELVCLAGFMRVLTPFFLRAFPGRVINIHPAILPSFPGVNAQKQAIDYGVKFSGCTVHFVDEGVDTGPIIIQAVVPVYDDDTEETLRERILKEEHRIYPMAIKLIAEGRVSVEGRKVRASAPKLSYQPLHNPPLDEGF
jgi:phosphoribosylglycinamide formyltransferase-1